MLFSSVIVAAFAASSALAMPYLPINPPLPGSSRAPSCNLNGAVLDLPAGQTTLGAPTGTLEHLALGVGIQVCDYRNSAFNRSIVLTPTSQSYTCASGVWTSVGAVASLYDISCAVGTPLFDMSQVAALKTLATKTAPILSHFFVANPTAGGTGVDPRFNLEPYATSKLSSILAKTNVGLFDFCVPIIMLLLVTCPDLDLSISRLHRLRAQRMSHGSN